MKSSRPVFSLIAIAVLTICATTPAHGQLGRTWVSGSNIGSDQNPCTRTAPCATFAGALAKTAAGGEIDAVDPGDFGTVTITNSITIDGGGGQVASILANSGVAIGVAAGTTAVVTLRNLRIQGAGTGTTGIDVLSAAVVHIEHCTIAGFTSSGIAIAPTTQPANGTQAFIEDTASQDNGQAGLWVGSQTSTYVHATVSNSRFKDNAGSGIESGNYAKTTIRNSEASDNGLAGFLTQPNAGTSMLSIVDSLAANNTVAGVQVGGGTAPATARISNVSLFTNATGISIGSNGTVQSFGNNNNAGSGTPNGSIAAQ